ncbi:MAG: hypothetical protein OXC09_00025 [Truepera sp.]|nr:hypothetical protein [Truepera sp.]
MTRAITLDWRGVFSGTFDPEETVFVDDNSANIAAGEQFGFTGIPTPDFKTSKERWNAVPTELALA